MVSSLTEVREGKGWRRNNRAWHIERKLEGERFSMSPLPYGEQPGRSTQHIYALKGLIILQGKIISIIFFMKRYRFLF